uniref:Ig-like domain-containing protein n=1 Tax=Oreochromis niloticus TaxID=8128 RepID=A0A669EFE2_ORENI
MAVRLLFEQEKISRVQQECCATMIVKLAALILLCTPSVIQTTEVPQLISLTVVDLGDNVTFGCEVSEKELKSFNLYKQSLGHLPQSVASVVFNQIALADEFKDSRFTVNKEASQYIFTIRNVSKEDEATYFCQTRTTYSQMFSSGTFLAVKDHNHQKSVYVKQNPEKESVLLGDSVTLECSLLSQKKEKVLQCPDDHRVYWFRAGSERFAPNIIYTLVNNSDEALKRRCVYSLTKTIQNSSDVGTYYCAVVTCGEILLGEGTKVETRPGLGPVVVILGVLLGCCVAVIALLLLYPRGINVCQHCKGEVRATNHAGCDVSNVGQANDLMMTDATVHYSSVRVNRVNRKRRESTQDYCVYAAVRQESHTQRQPSA